MLRGIASLSPCVLLLVVVSIHGTPSRISAGYTPLHRFADGLHHSGYNYAPLCSYPRFKLSPSLPPFLPPTLPPSLPPSLFSSTLALLVVCASPQQRFSKRSGRRCAIFTPGAPRASPAPLPNVRVVLPDICLSRIHLTYSCFRCALQSVLETCVASKSTVLISTKFTKQQQS